MNNIDLHRAASLPALRLALSALLTLASLLRAEEAPTLKLVGDWQVEVIWRKPGGTKDTTAVVSIRRPERLQITAERYTSLPLFNSNAWGGWSKGVPLRQLFAQECTTPDLLEPASLRVRAGTTPDAEVFEAGRDYQADLRWGSVGRLPGGRIGENQPVFVSYAHGLLRIDSLVVTAEGQVAVRQGALRSAAPRPPDLDPGERRLANIWLPYPIARLGPQHLFPILETTYPEPPKPAPTLAERKLPRTMSKLRQSRPLRVLAWGDSVTDGTYLPNWRRDRWQEQFVARLRQRFPQASVELLTEAWGGRNTASYLNEPPGSAHNYREKVLGAKPDLIVSEFVNDAGLSPAQVEEVYSRLLTDFQGIEAEWIILTPHYVRPDWMGLASERDCDEDPRPYVKGLREFADRHPVALADAARRYGRLWRQGLPHNSLMLNSINHPDERGMKLFADALMELFP
jgi:hypothetical protein